MKIRGTDFVMCHNAFINKLTEPTDADLAAALGPAKAVWDQLLTDLAQETGANIHEWKCYSPKRGWSLRVKCKARTIVWLAPSEDCFNVSFILGKQAMQAARQTKLSRRVVKVMDEAPKYPEGTGIRLGVKTAKDAEPVKRLAAIKLAN
jgi:hypothetical protein